MVTVVNSDLFLWLDEIVIYFLKLEPNSVVHELRALIAVYNIKIKLIKGGNCIAFCGS
jgi:hypothetical protein